jgi:hypothetical protein
LINKKKCQPFTNHETDGEICDFEVTETLYFLYSQRERQMSTLAKGKVTQRMCGRKGIMGTFWKLSVFNKNAHGTIV